MQQQAFGAQQQEQEEKQKYIIFKQEYAGEHAIPHQMRDNKHNCVKIADKVWLTKNLGSLCLNIKEWNAKHMLFLCRNQHKEIFKEIADIKFKYIQQLYLGYNFIQSLEPLSHLYAPCLQVLWIQDNLLTSLRPMKRMQSPNLSYIRLTQNYLCDSHDLADMRFSFPENMHLEYNKFGRVHFQDLRPLLKQQKLPKSGDFFLYFFSFSRIRQKKVIDCLSKKMPGITMGYQREHL